MSDVAIKVENLGKLYHIGGPQDRYKTIRDSIMDGVKAPFRRAGGLLRGQAHGAAQLDQTIWALKDVSFEVKQGEVVGIIGRNGAGKSTLLKILSRITEPTEGEVMLRGRVGSLLEVGTGFHPELTGRENVFLNGAILGMKRQEMDQKFDEIVDFSGVERFIDTPVKHYSSGMQVRLAFSVAAYLNPEILLIDEVLAVGDIAFQRKCLGKMENVALSGRTVLFVSHNMRAVRTLCPRALLVESGNLTFDGRTDLTLDAYNRVVSKSTIDKDSSVKDSRRRRGDGTVRFSSVVIKDKSNNQRRHFESGNNVRFVLEYQAFSPVNELFVAIGLRTGMNGDFVTTLRHQVSKPEFTPGKIGTLVVELPRINLRPGEYSLYYWLGDNLGRAYDVLDDLTGPLVITTDQEFETLGYDPSQQVGYFDIDSRII